MLGQNIGVVRIDDGVFRRALEQVMRMVHQIWSMGFSLATSMVRLLPCPRPARPARCHVEAMLPGYPTIKHASSCTDINAQFQSRGRDDAEQFTIEELLLDFASLAAR
jgi:hypothetical protein